MAGDRGYYLVEARWEHSHNAPGEDAFFMIDQIGGSLDDAKLVAQDYLNGRVASTRYELEWVEGVNRKSRCYYAHTPHVTFRITR